MAAKFTPGPWHLADTQREVRAMKVKLICQVPGGGIISTGVDKANARLIAASPDLLAALIAVVRVADRATTEFDAARAAIARATGEN